MLEDFVGTLVTMVPVFFLLVMTFGAGFVVGRVSKQDGR